MATQYSKYHGENKRKIQRTYILLPLSQHFLEDIENGFLKGANICNIDCFHQPNSITHIFQDTVMDLIHSYIYFKIAAMRSLHHDQSTELQWPGFCPIGIGGSMLCASGKVLLGQNTFRAIVSRINGLLLWKKNGL